MTKDELINEIDSRIQSLKDELVKYIQDNFSGETIEVSTEPIIVQPPPALKVCIDDEGYKAFFDAARSGSLLGPTLSQAEVDGCNEIIGECARVKWPLAWTAYALATAYHETAATMQPIKEIGRGAGKPYGEPGKDNGQVAFGRGFVQLTWDYNYEKMDQELNLNGALIANYDLALDPKIAAKIMIYGMENGSFTGKSIDLYLPPEADLHQFTNARRVVNALDRAVDIAEYALEFQTYLKAANWRC